MADACPGTEAERLGKISGDVVACWGRAAKRPRAHVAPAHCDGLGAPRGGKTRFAIELIKAAPSVPDPALRPGSGLRAGRGGSRKRCSLQREAAYAAWGNGLTRASPRSCCGRTAGNSRWPGAGTTWPRRRAAVAAATRLRRGRRGDGHRGPTTSPPPRRHPAATEGCPDPHKREQGRASATERVRRASVENAHCHAAAACVQPLGRRATRYYTTGRRHRRPTSARPAGERHAGGAGRARRAVRCACLCPPRY